VDISFIIITDEKRPEKIYQQLRTINKQQIPNYEIVICGNTDNLNLDNKNLCSSRIKLIKDAYNAERGSLGGLRNNACSKAQYENLVISDDDMLFSQNWYKCLLEAGNNYEIITTCIKNPDGTRFWDNACYMSPSKGHINLNYNEQDEYLYMSGGQALLIKKDIWNKIKWDENILIYSMKSLNDYGKGLHNEDTDFSKRCRESGFKITHNPNILVYHNDISYTALGRLTIRRNFMPDYRWALNINLPEPFLTSLAQQLLQSNIVEGIDILRKLQKNGSFTASNLISNFEKQFGGKLDNSEFNFDNLEYSSLLF